MLGSVNHFTGKLGLGSPSDIGVLIRVLFYKFLLGIPKDWFKCL